MNDLEVELYDINYIPDYEQAEEQRQANEAQRQANEEDRVEFYNDMVDKAESGYFDGFSPIVTTSKTGNTTTITIVDEEGTKTATITDGHSYYGVCDTASSGFTKEVTCSDFVLETGAVIKVKFTNGNNGYGPYKMNVNNTGVKDIYWGNKSSTSAGQSGTWGAGDVIAFVYDGTAYRTVGYKLATDSEFGLVKLAATINSNSGTVPTTGILLNALTGLEDQIYEDFGDALSGKEDVANKVTSVSNLSTDDKYPSAKAVYDYSMVVLTNAINTAKLYTDSQVGYIATALDEIQGEII